MRFSLTHVDILAFLYGGLVVGFQRF